MICGIQDWARKPDRAECSEGEGHGSELILEDATSQPSNSLAKAKVSPARQASEGGQRAFRSIVLPRSKSGHSLLLDSKRLFHLDIGRHSNHEQVQREHLECLKGEGEPWAGDVGVADVPDPIHGKSQDEQVLNADLLHQVVREEEEWNRNWNGIQIKLLSKGKVLTT